MVQSGYYDSKKLDFSTQHLFNTIIPQNIFQDIKSCAKIYGVFLMGILIYDNAKIQKKMPFWSKHMSH